MLTFLELVPYMIVFIFGIVIGQFLKCLHLPASPWGVGGGGAFALHGLWWEAAVV